jgi:KDO2-lipid IV(A) lauroyltransferase
MVLKFIVVPFLFLVSYLPMPMLHLKSRGFYYLVYYILGYRKKVVLENLRNSFPDKSDKEITAICKGFYKHFCDVIFETIKAFTISRSELDKRCYFTEESKKIFKEYSDAKQTVVVVIGHCSNWEWIPLSYQINFEQKLLGVYHPLSNKVFDEVILKMRSKFGGKIISMKEFYPFLIRNRNTNFSLGLNADQSPPPESAYWTKFLNQDTAVFNGPSKIAKKFNYPMVYGNAIRVKRGVYEVEFKLVCENPQAFTEDQLTEMHLKCLETNILQQPESWLWSHRRWKHKKPLAK